LAFFILFRTINLREAAGKLEFLRKFDILPVVKLFIKRLSYAAGQEYTIV